VLCLQLVEPRDEPFGTADYCHVGILALRQVVLCLGGSAAWVRPIEIMARLCTVWFLSIVRFFFFFFGLIITRVQPIDIMTRLYTIRFLSTVRAVVAHYKPIATPPLISSPKSPA